MKSGILIIDDEPLIRDLTKEILEGNGFEVYTAEDGIEGLKVFGQNKSKIGLVILDLLMPGMDGYETFKRLKGIDNEIKVIVITGYAPIKEEGLVEEGASAIVKKPFTVKELLSTVNKVIGAAIP